MNQRFHSQRTIPSARPTTIRRVIAILALLAFGSYGHAAPGIAGSTANAPAVVDLTAAGPSDWTHWGRVDDSFDRKAGVAPQISDYTPIAGTSPSSNDSLASGYSWTDGTPTASATDTRSGLRAFNAGRGYIITAPADATARRLKVWVSMRVGATGRLTASLSDASAAPYVVDLALPSGNKNTTEVTLDYSAGSAGQTLEVRWEKTNETTWVSLDSAALAVTGNQPPILAPVGDQGAIELNLLTVGLAAADPDGPPPITFGQTNTLPNSPEILTDNGDGTAELNWAPATGDATDSPYSVTVTAMDGLGATSEETFAVTVSSGGQPGPRTHTDRRSQRNRGCGVECRAERHRQRRTGTDHTRAVQQPARLTRDPHRLQQRHRLPRLDPGTRRYDRQPLHDHRHRDRCAR
jgi:hypothetical protein